MEEAIYLVLAIYCRDLRLALVVRRHCLALIMRCHHRALIKVKIMPRISSVSNWRSLSIMLAFSTSFAFSCKPAPQNGSSVKTLDNVRSLGDTGVKHPCGLNYDGRQSLPSVAARLGSDLNIVSPGDSTLKNAVIGALESVPEPFLQAFFHVFKGQILIGNATVMCKAAPFSKGQRELIGKQESVSACWLAPSSGQPMRMVLNPDVMVIRSSILRLFAYWHTEFFVNGLLQSGVQAPFNGENWQNYAHSFIAERGRLVSAFISDLSVRGQTSSKKLLDYNVADPSGFGNLIYANAVDSYYCSLSTRRAFQVAFKSTWSVFTDKTNPVATASELGNPRSGF